MAHRSSSASAHPPSSPDLAVLISFSGDGGVERMISHLLHAFADRGLRVDLLLIKDRGIQHSHFPAAVRVHKLAHSHTFFTIGELARYLKTQRPRAVLVAKHRAIIAAVVARAWSGTRMPLVGRIGTNVTGALAGRAGWRLWWWRLTMQLFYRRTDGIVAVSEGVAQDICRATGLGASRVQVIRNPVITNELPQLAAQPLDHPWFAPGQPPVILGMGRFTAQKDFPTLIRAFALVRRTRPCRLLLLGQGGLGEQYLALATELGIAADLDLPGFIPNPYPYVARAAVFALSSAWEGSPNALTEALALGIPAVATDCPSGPREILQGGRYGPLVAVGDVAALAEALRATLEAPLPSSMLRAAVAEYTASASAAAYLRELRLE